MTQPILLCGLGQLGWSVLGHLKAAGLEVAVVDLKPRPDHDRLEGVAYLQGDIRNKDVLLKAGLSQARGVILATSDDLANIASALQIRSLNPSVRIVIRMFNQNLLARLGKTVHNVFALSVSGLTAPVLALTAIAGEALGSFGCGEERYQVAEVVLARDSRSVGQPLGAFAKANASAVVAHSRRGDPLQFAPQLEYGAALQPGDRIVLCGEPAGLEPLLRAEEEDRPVSVRWAGAVRRFTRMIWRTVREIDLPVQICLAVLLLVVGVSTLVYHFGMNLTLADGLYHTISVLSTGADLGGEELKEGWHKVFVSVLRVVGVALMAAFTAIVTNHLLRVRLGGVLEMRRIPEAGHIVVCGMGNIGFRVCEELMRQGQRVVIIERDPVGKFVATVRRLGGAVIQGDATVPEVLRQANTATARAVVASTSDPLANLEIALLTRELNPKQRVVVRMTDPNLAQTLRESANIRFAFSPTALAAPAFVAALFGDRVLSIFLVEGRVLAVVDLVVEETDAGWIGQRVGELLERHHASGVRLLRRRLEILDVEQEVLEVGDQLMLILAILEMGRLLSQAAAPSPQPAVGSDELART